jgi:predicted RNase H-like nuclease (RuvC/YqgF family)
MGRMTTRIMLVALALVPTGVRAQSAATGHDTPRDPVAAEVALLRRSVERLAVVVVKSQVLAARLAAQQQRVLSDQAAVARVEEAVDAVSRRQERTRATLDLSSRALANVVEEPRSELRREVENLKADLDAQDREIESLRTRLSQAEQSLRSEQQSYTGLDTALKALVSEVERLGR